MSEIRSVPVLRALERDGLVARTVYPAVPARRRRRHPGLLASAARH